MNRGNGWTLYCSVCGAQVRRTAFQAHRLQNHQEIVQALNLGERAFYRRMRRLALLPIVAWAVVYFVAMFYLFGHVPWWHALLAVLVDSAILIPVVAAFAAHTAWIRGIEPLQHAQVSCPICTRRFERREFLQHLSESHRSASRLARLGRSGGTVLILAALIVPLTIDNLVLVGWLSDSYLMLAEVLLFAVTLAFLFWVIVVGKVPWERRVKSLSNVV